MSYKIAVVGPIPRDTITTHRGEVIQKYGCVTHPTIGLSKLLSNDDQVIPISNVHKRDFEAIKALFNSYKNININGLDCAADAGTIIDLKFLDQNNRIEKQLTNMQPISIENITSFLDVDVFVFIPITDFEVTLETLKYIKSHSQATIVFDAHGPTTYVTPKGDRLRRFWKEKEDWFPYIDVLKMNLEESLCCWQEMDYDTEEFYDENNTAHLDAFAMETLQKGVKHLYVTLDSRGCQYYSLESETLVKTFINSIPVDFVVDTTGCGDSFAGGLSFGFAKYKDPIKAAQFANVLGARRTQGKGFDVFKSLKETEEIISNNY